MSCRRGTESGKVGLGDTLAGLFVRRLLCIITGFALAVVAAAATEVLFAFPPAAMARGGLEALSTWAGEAGILTLAAATHTAIFSFLFAAVAIMIGEWLHRREWTFYVTTGVLIALGGFLSQYAAEKASQPTIVNNYALMAFVTAGAVGGLVYWMFAGRAAGRPRPERDMSGAAAEQRADEDIGKRGMDSERPDTARVAGATASTSVPTAGAPRKPSPLRAVLDAADRDPVKSAET